MVAEDYEPSVGGKNAIKDGNARENEDLIENFMEMSWIQSVPCQN
jgi:hypothetical protein